MSRRVKTEYQPGEVLTREQVRQLIDQLQGMSEWMDGLANGPNRGPKHGYQAQVGQEEGPTQTTPDPGQPEPAAADPEPPSNPLRPPSQTTPARPPPSGTRSREAPPPPARAPPPAAATPLADLPALPNEEEVMRYLEPELLFIGQVASESGRTAKALVPHYESCRNVTALRKLLHAPETTKDEVSYVELRRNFLSFLERMGSAAFFRKNDHALGVWEGCVLMLDSELMHICLNSIRTLATFLAQPGIERWPVRAFLLDSATRSAFAKVVASTIAHGKTLVPTQPQFRVSHRRVGAESWTVQAEFSGCTLSDGAVRLLADPFTQDDPYSYRPFGFGRYDALVEGRPEYIL